MAISAPEFPAPTNARTFVILRLLGVLAGVLAKAVDGRMPADQETIRYTGVYGKDRDGAPYLMREVLGGVIAVAIVSITMGPVCPAGDGRVQWLFQPVPCRTTSIRPRLNK